jgi:uncharacterized protein YcbK (DUF882 family)
MWQRFVAPLFCAMVASASVTTRAARDLSPARSMRLDSKKSATLADEDPELLGTIVQTHTDEHVPLDDGEPSQKRFESLLADRVTGQHHEIDPRLLAMLRDLAREHPGARVEIVSGFRSEKLNETLRKKGHHVATHSQHSLGHAVDFRVVPADAARALSPLEIEREVREDLHWDGGVGVYLSESDWFTHVDVGPNRRWNGL